MNPYNAYLKNSVETADPLEQIILLYERAIFLLKGIKEDIEQKRVKEKVEKIYRVDEIIRALDSALNYEKGGEIAKNLHKIYDFIQSRLLLINSRNDRKMVDEVISLLEELLEGWKGIRSKV